MSTTASRPEVAPARAAAVVALAGAVTAAAWAVTARRMAGMDAGPWTDLGAPGWFAVSWLVMMAAMMVPALVPAALALARAGERAAGTFAAGYLAVWTTAGLVAYALFEAVRGLDAGALAWDRAGRYVAAGVILVAAAYQFTAAKRACLDRCRAPARPRTGGGLRGGLRHGTACVGCCAGLMAALFALGVMSLAWMAAIGALIAVERLAPRRAPAVYAVAAALAVLGVWIAVDPGSLPGLTLPGAMPSM